MKITSGFELCKTTNNSSNYFLLFEKRRDGKWQKATQVGGVQQKMRLDFCSFGSHMALIVLHWAAIKKDYWCLWDSYIITKHYNFINFLLTWLVNTYICKSE